MRRVVAASVTPEQGAALRNEIDAAIKGGTCSWLGRIYEDGNKAAPGVHKLLGKQPQTLILQAYDNGPSSTASSPRTSARPHLKTGAHRSPD